MSGLFSANFMRAGKSRRHAIHQGAKKSTTTSLFCAMAAWKASGDETDIKLEGSASFHLWELRPVRRRSWTSAFPEWSENWGLKWDPSLYRDWQFKILYACAGRSNPQIALSYSQHEKVILKRSNRVDQILPFSVPSCLGFIVCHCFPADRGSRSLWVDSG